MIIIEHEDLNTVKIILSKHLPGVAVWAFGSRVNGKASQFSDFDLAIISDQALSIDKLTDLRQDFSNSSLPFKVDLVDWATINDEFKKIIDKQHIAIQ